MTGWYVAAVVYVIAGVALTLIYTAEGDYDISGWHQLACVAFWLPAFLFAAGRVIWERRHAHSR